MVRHLVGIPNATEEDGIEPLQDVQYIFRAHLSMLQIIVATPIKVSVLTPNPCFSETAFKILMLPS